MSLALVKGETAAGGGGSRAAGCLYGYINLTKAGLVVSFYCCCLHAQFEEFILLSIFNKIQLLDHNVCFFIGIWLFKHMLIILYYILTIKIKVCCKL